MTALWLAAPTVYAQGASGADVANEVQASVSGYAEGADGGAVDSVTATGTFAHWGTVAADWRLYPPGTRLRIEGFPDDVFTVEDTGGAVRGNVFDIWFPDLPRAAAFGTKSLRVTILGAS
jgi:3D (Asp-Asp-Asp) domain-containing protein